MSARRRPPRVVLLLMATLAAACAGWILTAPPGSTIFANANPPFIPSHTGVSEIQAIITEPAGTLVADGTQVFFLTDLGSIPFEARTRNGVARVFLRADGRSGEAHVRIQSGGSAPAPGPTPSTAPSPTGGTGGTGGVATAAGIARTSASFDSMNTADVTVVIGNILVEAADQIRLRAEPPRITISNSTHIIATVVDVRGNPASQVPVYFRVADAPATEFFDIQAPVFTNNNGEAENVMRTRRQFTGNAQVVVEVPGAGGFFTSAPLVILIVNP